MTPQEKVRRLATEVMGWTRCESYRGDSSRHLRGRTGDVGQGGEMSEGTTVVLERFTYTALQHLTVELARDFAIAPKSDTSIHTSFAVDRFLWRIRQDIFGKQLEFVDIEHPSDWWQAVKERWAPKWAKRRWPVCYDRHVVNVKALYPTIPEIPDHPHQINADYVVESNQAHSDGFGYDWEEK